MLNEFLEQVKNESNRNRLQFRSAADVCSQPSKANWLIRNFLERENLSVLFGESGCGKSFQATDMGLCIAAGLPWHGNDVHQGPVFYLCGEGFSGMGRRLHGWSQHHGIDLSNVPFFLSDRPGQLLDDAKLEEIKTAIGELVEKHGQPALIIIDTLNRNFGPGDENKTEDMTKFINAGDIIRQAFNCGVLTVHHSGLTATDRARGAGALKAALDWEYRLTKNCDGTRTLSCTKSKDHEPPADMIFELRSVDLDWLDDDGTPLTTCVVEHFEGTPASPQSPLKGARKIAFDALMKLGGEGVFIEDWRMKCYDAGISPTSSQSAKQKAFKRAVSELRDTGHVSAKNDLWWANNPDMSGHIRTFE